MDFSQSERQAITGLSPDIYDIRGDATQPQGDANKVLAHICNDEGRWGAGFVLALSKRWEEPERQYRNWFAHKSRPMLGDVQFVPVAPDLTVANMIGQHGIRRSAGGKPPIRYEAVQAALTRVAIYAKERRAEVHMPRIGCGLAGGTWDKMEPIICQTLISVGVPVTVYDPS